MAATTTSTTIGKKSVDVSFYTAGDPVSVSTFWAAVETWALAEGYEVSGSSCTQLVDFTTDIVALEQALCAHVEACYTVDLFVSMTFNGTSTTWSSPPVPLPPPP
jgi:hypothetical protein